MAIHNDERGPVDRLLEGLESPLEYLQVVGVARPQDVPAIGDEPRRHVLAKGPGGVPFDRDLVVVVDPAQFGQLEMSGQRRCLAGHTLHHAAVAAQRVHVVIEHHEVGAVEVAAHPSLGDGHADAGGNALPERPRGRLDAGRPPVLRMARALAVELSEPLDVVEGDREMA